MTDRERKLKRKIQFWVAGSMATFFCLLLTLVVTLVVVANKRAEIDNLERINKQIVYGISVAGSETAYFSSKKFIQEWALKWIGYGKPGSYLEERP